MNVSILARTSAWGGAETHTVALSRSLLARGHKVSIVELGCDVYTRCLRKYIQNVEIISVPLKKPLEEIGFIKAYRMLHGLPRDVGILVKGGFYSGNWQLDLAARAWFRLYVAIEHQRSPSMPAKSSRRHLGGIVPGVGAWWFRLYGRRWARSFGPRLIVTVSEDVRQRLIRLYRFPSRKIVTIHGGIDTSIFQPNLAARRAARRAWGIAENTFVFGAVGRLSAEKGYAIAIELFSRLSREFPDKDIRLVLVGNGPEERKLRAAAESTGLGDRIIFTGFTEQPWQAYPAFDVFVMPSVTEGLGLALLEAMACQCPGIAMNVGGVGEIIADPKMGWLIPEGDLEGFFAALREAAACPFENLVEMGKHAREQVVSHFEARVLFERLAHLVECASASEGGITDAHMYKALGG